MIRIPCITRAVCLGHHVKMLPKMEWALWSPSEGGPLVVHSGNCILDCHTWYLRQHLRDPVRAEAHYKWLAQYVADPVVRKGLPNMTVIAPDCGWLGAAAERRVARAWRKASEVPQLVVPGDTEHPDVNCVGYATKSDHVHPEWTHWLGGIGTGMPASARWTGDSQGY